jgi:cell division septation protein DedD
MMVGRRLGRAHHEFRFGTRELVVLGGVACLIAGFVFVAGVVVGRETTRGRGPAHVEVGRDPRRDDVDGLRPGEAGVKTAATRAEEKVTFYRTLTAPTQDVPQLGKPTIEERLVPKDEPTPAAAVEAVPEPSRIAPAAPPAVPEPPRPAPERRTPKAPEAAAAPRPTRPAPPAARPAPALLASASAATSPDAWTVQVSAFRSRALAEELRARLAARGFDAYVFPSITEDGRPRYRVRVGAYAARSDAERVAGELRSERGLNPLVTPRTR